MFKIAQATKGKREKKLFPGSPKVRVEGQGKKKVWFDWQKCWKDLRNNRKIWDKIFLVPTIFIQSWVHFKNYKFELDAFSYSEETKSFGELFAIFKLKISKIIFSKFRISKKIWINKKIFKSKLFFLHCRNFF